MFTGLIEEIGELKSLSPIGPNQSRLTINCHKIQDDLKLGDSVAVDGVCLTVVAYNSTEIALELSNETLTVSLLGKKRMGMKLNLERALRMGDRLGGHLVQGHTDCLAQVLSIEKIGGFYEIEFTVDPKVQQYFVHKGSVTINGISLTIASLKETSFRVAIIPHTFQGTTLRELNGADWVHIETDIVARYIERLLPFQEKPKDSKVTYAFLKEHGF
ncbi:MAG: riboflavin synthase [SAR324 cluster bacterium]|uniref:Riboflavin synthase n=1 Tax=SAR324 cluster bacterium TaxID=2024889 RepID=A0A2A4TAQ7_9DELT|nr:MAG: riboflavin synthase [SAR324 cluster bacterium]